MSEESNVDQIETSENTQTNILRYSTRLAERTIERALDVIYEKANCMDLQIHEWRHSADKIEITIVTD